MPEERAQPWNLSRRALLKAAGLSLGLLAGAGAWLGWTRRAQATAMVWQLDPNKCVSCGKCATECVLQDSAVKCVHAYDICGYCRLCSGYFEPDAPELNTAAENQQCPMGAIQRTFIEDPYYQYVIDEKLCTGCSQCVKGCAAFGNGSLFLQVRHDRCVNCNQCRIALHCPSQAFARVPLAQPYLLKQREHSI